MREEGIYRITPRLPRRPGNVICVEVGEPAPRCALKTPEHWPGSMGGARWVLSGGSPLILGVCSARCPLKDSGDPGAD